MAVMAVHTASLDLLAVDINDTVSDAEILKSEGEGEILVPCLDKQGVKIGQLVAPKLRSAYVYDGSLSRESASRCHGLARGGDEGVFVAHRGVCNGLYGKRALGIVCGQRGAKINVLQVLLVAEKQIYLSEHTREAELVLILQIRARAPLEHNNAEGVDTCVKKRGDIYFRGAVADLAVACKIAVNEEIEAGVNTLEVYVYLMLQRRLGEGELTAVESAGVKGGNVRGIEGKGIGNVGVLRNVIALVHNSLPAAGDSHGVEALCGEGLGEEIVHLSLGGIEAEVPISAEGDKTVAMASVTHKSLLGGVIGDEISSGSFAVNVQRVKICVVLEFEHDLFPFFGGCFCDIYNLWSCAP